ncbi:hypothetical protein ACSNOK_29080 [Streptomyces sp. URMC 126]|uniref:hypothetical protein n=1 Tax=Streptomyces sp. URMC 126 TaxID=3423401 RepID=UPI003F1A4CBB
MRINSLPTRQENLDITDLDIDVQVPETDISATEFGGYTSTCNSWNTRARCWNCT